MKNITLLVGALSLSLSLSACVSESEGILPPDDALIPSGGDDETAWFRIHSPQLRDADGDGIWSPGEQISLDLSFTNQGEDHFNYPGLLTSTDTDNVTSDSPEFWWFGITAGETYEVSLDFTADDSISDGTVVTFIASAYSLACDDDEPSQAAYCPEPNSLLLPVLVGDRLPEL